jgi:tetratricopeptide (TPR) repeat protein
MEEETFSTPDAQPALAWNIPSLTPYFTGRAELLSRLHELLVKHRIVALTQPQTLHPLGGVGKTQTAIAYATQHRQDYRYGFWINAATRETIITSLLDIAHVLTLPEQHMQNQTLIVEAVRTWLNTHEGWLLILDNVGDLPLAATYVPCSKTGHVLLTTHQPVPESLAHGLEVGPMQTQEAMALLTRYVGEQGDHQGRLYPEWAGHPPDGAQGDPGGRLYPEWAGHPPDGAQGDPGGRLYPEWAGHPPNGAQGDRQGRPYPIRRRFRPFRVGATLAVAPLAPAPPTQAPLLARQVMKQLMHTMSGLPLALEQVGVYIGETHCTPAAYLWRYYQQRGLLRQASSTGSHNPVATTAALCLQQIEQRDALAMYVLHACTLLAPEAIPEDLFTVGAAKLGPGLLPLQMHPDRLSEALDLLQRYALIKRHPEQRTFSLHRLLQAVMAESLEETVQRMWAERLLCALDEAFPEGTDRRVWSQCQRLVLHVRQSVRWLERWPLALSEASMLFNKAGSYLNQRAQYAEAEQLLQRAVEVGEQAWGAEHPELEPILNNLATLYYEQRRYGEAEQLFRRAVAIRVQTLGPRHPELATMLSNLALLYQKQRRYVEAEQLMRYAIFIIKEVLGLKHTIMTSILNNLAYLYYEQGRYAEAERLLQHTIAIAEQVPGLEHSELAPKLSNLALLYYEQGRYAEAEPLYQRAITISERTPGPDHPQTRQIRINYATLLSALGREQVAQ